LVEVKLEKSNSHIKLSIKDDGRGFHTGELELYRTSIDGMGLGGMQERLEFVGGHLEILSRRGEGTELIATIPLHPN
jgi:signal transduction histidine kinase